MKVDLNKNRAFRNYVLLFISLFILGSSMIAVSQNIPDFTMQLTNGKSFSSKDLSDKKPVILIYFAPDCEHCQVLMNEVFKKIQQFQKAQIILATFTPVNEVIAFEKAYQTAKYPNIKVGIEKPIFFFRVYYNLQNTPFTALYDKKGKLIVSYKTQTPVSDLIKHLNALK